jgi:hypothetical protein
MPPLLLSAAVEWVQLWQKLRLASRCAEGTSCGSGGSRALYT